MALAALGTLAVADPNTNSLFPPCVWRTATGWLCPGCGSARSIYALLNGQIYLALETNALVLAALPLGAADLLRRWYSGEGVLTHRVHPLGVAAIAIGVILFGVVRNLSL